jgi:hypothetical protein
LALFERRKEREGGREREKGSGNVVLFLCRLEFERGRFDVDDDEEEKVSLD